MQVAITSAFAQDVARTSQERTQEKAELAVQKMANDMEGQPELALIQSVTGVAPEGSLGSNVNIRV